MSKIHMLGIGGIGLSALAQILRAQGDTVSGCDPDDTPWISDIKKDGISIERGHDPKHITDDVDHVIYSLAVPHDNPELETARKKKKKTLTYPEAVGGLTKKMRAILVAGTHGKTTTTGMLAKVLSENNFDPTVIVGALLKEFGNKNFRVGKSENLLIEACEYMRGFLHYAPNVLLITNIEHDHFDTYQTFQDYFEAFLELAQKLPEDGVFIGNGDDENVKKIADDLKKKGLSSKNIILFNKKTKAHHFDLKIPGEHNRTNALAAYTLARALGIPENGIIQSLNEYHGASRRLEFLGEIDGVKIYDDYGHHPTEIRATLQALREKYPKERICVIYQPHQFNRSIHLLEEFGKSFADADEVIVPDIYAARDTKEEKETMSAEKFATEIAKHHPHARFGHGFSKTAEYLKKWLSEFDIILIMGAGDVWKISNNLKS